MLTIFIIFAVFLLLNVCIISSYEDKGKDIGSDLVI